MATEFVAQRSSLRESYIIQSATGKLVIIVKYAPKVWEKWGRGDIGVDDVFDDYDTVRVTD